MQTFMYSCSSALIEAWSAKIDMCYDARGTSKGVCNTVGG